jgi:hypothetical protein
MAINAFGTPMAQVTGLMPHIHKLIGIPQRNLWQWQDMIREGPDWRPWHTHHGRHRHIFSPVEELSIVSFIRANFIEPVLILTDTDFLAVAINAFCNRVRTPMRLLPHFNALSDSSLPSEHITVCLRGRFTANTGQL